VASEYDYKYPKSLPPSCMGVKLMNSCSCTLIAPTRAYVCVMMQSPLLGVESCRRRILTTSNLPGVSQEASEEERLIQISSLLPLDCTNMVLTLHTHTQTSIHSLTMHQPPIFPHPRCAVWVYCSSMWTRSDWVWSLRTQAPGYLSSPFRHFLC